MVKIARLAKIIKTNMPNQLLALVLTLGWRVDRVRNGLFSEVERRWPAVFISTWRGLIVVRVKKQ